MVLDNFVIERVLEDLARVDTQIQNLVSTKTSYENNIPTLKSKIDSIEDTITMIAESKEYLRKAIDIIYCKSLGELEERLNTAIKYIYFDRDFTIKLSLDDKRGKSLSILLIDEEGQEMSLRDGTGAGIRNIISFVMHAYYLLSKNSNILLVDEKYSQISQGYIGRFFEFAKKLCEASGLTLIMISHDSRLLDRCDYKYNVTNGVVTKIN